MADRQYYRNQNIDAGMLQIAFLSDTKETTVGELIDAGGGVCLQFSAPHKPSLAIGGEVKLQLTSTLLNKPVIIIAKVVHRSEEDEFRRYAVKFNHPEKLCAQIPPELRSLFHQSQMYRVEPDINSPVIVWLKNGNNQNVKTKLIDISGSGMGISIPSEREIEFQEVTETYALPQLSDQQHSFEIKCIIRHRRLDGTQVCYGIEFMVDSDKKSQHMQQDIIDYVMKRQLEIFQKRQGRIENSSQKGQAAICKVRVTV